MLALVILPSFIRKLPVVLATIVISSVVNLVAIGEAHLWKVRKLDFMLWVIAFWARCSWVSYTVSSSLPACSDCRTHECPTQIACCEITRHGHLPKRKQGESPGQFKGVLVEGGSLDVLCQCCVHQDRIDASRQVEDTKYVVVEMTWSRRWIDGPAHAGRPSRT